MQSHYELSFIINRVQELNTDSGVLIGLEVLASKTGEKLWRKLFYR